MHILEKIYTIFSILLFFVGNAFAASEGLCPKKILDRGTLRGVFLGTQCEDFCYAAFRLDSDEQVVMFADPDIVEKQLGKEGNYVEVSYTVEQFWIDLGNECTRSEVYTEGKIIKNNIDKKGIKSNIIEYNMCTGDGDGCYAQCQETTNMNFITLKSDGTGTMDGYRANDFPFTWESIKDKFIIFHYDGHDEEYIIDTTKEHGTLLIGKTECLKKIR